jgi:hypothetical protein
VRLLALRHSWPIVPASGDSEDDCGEILARETEVLEENLPQRHFCPSQIPTWSDPGLNPGRRGGKTATNRLSYGAEEKALEFNVSTIVLTKFGDYFLKLQRKMYGTI